MDLAALDHLPYFGVQFAKMEYPTKVFETARIVVCHEGRAPFEKEEICVAGTSLLEGRGGGYVLVYSGDEEDGCLRNLCITRLDEILEYETKEKVSRSV